MTWPNGGRVYPARCQPPGFQPSPLRGLCCDEGLCAAFGEALHDEVRSRGVVVTTLCPGHTATGFDAAAGATVSPLLRLLTMTARPVATSGIQALSKGKATVVAGLANKAAAFSNRLTPRPMQRATMRTILGP